MCDGFNAPTDNLSVPLEVAAFVLFNPVIDNGPEEDGGYGHPRIKDHFPAFSPAHNISPGLPPMLILQGTEDKLIPVETINRFAAKMQAAGNQVEVVFYEGQGHGFINCATGTSLLYRQTVGEVRKYLMSMGWDLEPRNPE
jgi:acetyl esterase/lipase